MAYKRNLSYSKTSNDTDMKLGPVTKHIKKNTAMSMTITLYWQIVAPLSLFQFTVNLEKSGRRDWDA